VEKQAWGVEERKTGGVTNPRKKETFNNQSTHSLRGLQSSRGEGGTTADNKKQKKYLVAGGGKGKVNRRLGERKNLH